MENFKFTVNFDQFVALRETVIMYKKLIDIGLAQVDNIQLENFKSLYNKIAEVPVGTISIPKIF